MGEKRNEVHLCVSRQRHSVMRWAAVLGQAFAVELAHRVPIRPGDIRTAVQSSHQAGRQPGACR